MAMGQTMGTPCPHRFMMIIQTWTWIDNDWYLSWLVTSPLVLVPVVDYNGEWLIHPTIVGYNSLSSVQRDGISGWWLGGSDSEPGVSLGAFEGGARKLQGVVKPDGRWVSWYLINMITIGSWVYLHTTHRQSSDHGDIWWPFTIY